MERAEHTDNQVNGVHLRVVVDLNRCQAYARCCFLAPEMFELHGEEALWYELLVEMDDVRTVMKRAA